MDSPILPEKIVQNYLEGRSSRYGTHYLITYNEAIHYNPASHLTTRLSMEHLYFSVFALRNVDVTEVGFPQELINAIVSLIYQESRSVFYSDHCQLKQIYPRTTNVQEILLVEPGRRSPFSNNSCVYFDQVERGFSFSMKIVNVKGFEASRGYYLTLGVSYVNPILAIQTGKPAFDVNECDVYYSYGYLAGRSFAEARFRFKEYTGPASFLKKGTIIEMKIEHTYTKQKRVTYFLNGDEIVPTLCMEGKDYRENEPFYPIASNFEYEICSLEYSMLSTGS